MAFADNLQQLPSIAHLAALELLDAEGQCVATIENKPGKTGSLTIYHALAAKYGSINAAAATEGLDLFAEHTADARNRPGAHPNIDRLFQVLADGRSYGVRPITA